MVSADIIGWVRWTVGTVIVCYHKEIADLAHKFLAEASAANFVTNYLQLIAQNPSFLTPTI